MEQTETSINTLNPDEIIFKLRVMIKILGEEKNGRNELTDTLND